MNPIESGIPSTTGFDSSAATAGAMTPSTTSANGTGSVATTTSTSSVSPQLQAASQSTQTTSAAANNDQFSLMTKVVDALVSVVTALVSLVTNLMNQFKGNGAGGINGGNGTGNTANPNGTGSPGAPGNSGGATNPGNGTSPGGVSPGQGPNTNPTQTVVRSALDVNKNNAGMITVRTLDGYTIRAEGRDQAWSITGPDGKTTRIWGDPHVTESDGDKWDFINGSTFMFGKNKVTVEVVPAGNGQTYSARITVYSDHERVTIDGIEKNQPSIVAASSDGLTHDASLADGDIYKRVMTPTGEAWVSASTNKVVPTTK
jgi:hypothetical protein